LLRLLRLSEMFLVLRLHLHVRLLLLLCLPSYHLVMLPMRMPHWLRSLRLR
jgi:hypothetical protein